MDPKPISTSERLDSSRKKITNAAQVLANNVVRVRAQRCGETSPKSLLGDTVRAIHSRWLQQFPGLKHDLMSPEEFEQKHEWIRGINNGMKEAPDAYAFLVSEAPWLLL
jgi:hypothetical protein